MLTVEKVTYSRDDTPIVDGVSLSVGRGRLLCLEGGNGSGKTTLLKLMCGLLEPESGRVLWDGVPVRSADSGYRSQMAYLGHKDGLKPDLGVLENLEAHAGLCGGTPALSPAEALARVGLSGMGRVPCARLSAGQSRRAALARLLVSRVAIWLLDEPFANLDEDGAALVRRIVSGQLREGMAVLTAPRASGSGDLPAETFRMRA